MAKVPLISLRYIEEDTLTSLKTKQAEMIAKHGYHIKIAKVVDQIVKEWKELKELPKGN